MGGQLLETLAIQMNGTCCPKMSIPENGFPVSLSMNEGLNFLKER
jgi:hypothetical protein